MRVCLVTGASRGIGRATAQALAASGWRVALMARAPEPLHVLARELGEDNALAVPGDVADEEAVRQAITSMVERWGRLDALVCAAGLGAFMSIVETSQAEWDRQIAANLTGTFLCCREALKVMLPQKRGHLVTILSVASKVAFSHSAAYCASKWGAYGLTKALAEEVRRDGVRVTAVLPGSTDTSFWDAIAGGGPPRADMLQAESVARAVRYALDAPADASVDEIHLMPQKGIL